MPFERHRQDEVVTLFQDGLLSYDFRGNDAWKLLNEWFVADRVNKEMKDVYSGFNMAATTPAASKQAAAAAACQNNDSDAISFEGLHFMTAIDSLTDKVVGCVGIKRPDQHTLAILQQSAEQFYTNKEEGSDVAAISRETIACELVRLSVDKTYRRRGIGQRLVQAVEHFAKQHGYRCICLCTLQVQTQAVVLYQNCGYSLVKEVPLDYSMPNINMPPEYLSGKHKIMSLVYLCKQLDY